MRASGGVTRHWVRSTATWICVVLSLIPIVLTGIAALTVDWNAGPFAGGVTLDWVVDGFPQFLPRLLVSAQIAALTLLINIVLGIPLAWMFARGYVPGLTIIQWFTRLPLSIPGMALGLALVAGHPQLQSSGALVVAGHVLLTMPFVLAALTPVLAEREHQDLEHVAATLGASFARRFITVTLPHLRTAVISASLMVIALSFGEFNITYFVLSPATPTLPVGLFSDFIYGRVSAAAAQTLLYCLAVIPIAVVVQMLGNAAMKRATP